MSRVAEQRRVPDEVLSELHRQLRMFWAMGGIEEDAYILGIHLLARMAKLDSLEIAVTWKEVAEVHIVQGGEVIAGPVTRTLFGFLGALQQLHEWLGLFSHIHMPGIEEAIREAEASEQGISYHFTQKPGQGAELLGYEILMIFCYRPQFGYCADSAYEGLQEKFPAMKLPTRVKIARSGARK